MTEYDNNLTGILSKNDRKDEDWQADYKGSCEIGGVEYWIDAHVRERKDGTGRFLSLKFRDKSEAPASKPKPRAAVSAGEDFPF